MNHLKEEHKKKHHKEVDLLLVMKSWVKNIPENDRNIIISQALNHCVKHKKVKIIGYLITKRRLFLIIIIKNHSLQQVLDGFYEQVALGIIQYEKMRAKYRKEAYLINENYQELFERFPFFNPNIKAIITGQVIKLKYYDPHIARLEDQIKNYNFCSKIDYSGAIGPVIVNTHYIHNHEIS